MADVNGVFQIEMRRQSREIVGIVIHIMTAARLGRSAVAAAVMGYDAIALTEEEQHLIVPVIGRQRPAMAEHNGLTFAPVLVVDLNAVFGCYHTHDTSSLRCRRLKKPLSLHPIAAAPVRPNNTNV